MTRVGELETPLLHFRKNDKPAPPEPPGEPDVLAEQEQAEFEASVRAARQRAQDRQAATVSAVVAEPEESEIEWTEQSDIYRPAPADLQELLLALGLPASAARSDSAVLLAVRHAAMQAMQAHLREDLSVELGGLLIGRAFVGVDRARFVTLVEAALPATAGDGTATSFTYTAASWQGIMEAYRAMDAGWTVVGSYHSHPGLGVFLSPTDLATQEDVFPHPWQTAIVIDPVSGAIGSFAGIEGAPCPLLVVAQAG